MAFDGRSNIQLAQVSSSDEFHVGPSEDFQRSGRRTMDFQKNGAPVVARQKVLLTKNLKLKFRGSIKWCTCCETIVPVAILALLCIGAYYEVDKVYPDRIYDTFAIQDPKWAKQHRYIEDRAQSQGLHRYDCTRGYKLIFSPNTEVVQEVANRALNQLLCPTDTEFEVGMNSVRSTRSSSPSGEGIGKFIE